MTPFIGATAQTPTTVTGCATRDQHDGHRADQRHRLHVHGDGHQRASAPGPPPPRRIRHADRADRAGGADRGHRDGGQRTATVSWTAPANGGSAITSYTVTPFIGTAAQTPTTVTGAPPATTTTVPGLTNGTAYTFKVTATNTIGTGPGLGRVERGHADRADRRRRADRCDRDGRQRVGAR